MFWADHLVKNIVETGKYKSYRVDDMKTPSGRIHAGALRGVIIHDLLFKILKEQGHDATYTYVFNDMDPMDGFPGYLDESFRQHMGKPLFHIPSPEKGHESMARCYAEQFIGVFNSLGVVPKILWSSEMYKAGKFNDVIRKALDRVDIIRRLYKNVSGYNKPKGWYPFQVICPSCGKVGTTLVTGWDGKEVTFECQEHLVKWADGCGYKGEISPFNGNGKLMWKVDWAAHWKVIGVTIEGAGKDHMAATGSHDLSSAISQEVFQYETPYPFLYEWFLAKGGAKMSSSKGVGVSALEMSKTLPPELLRFLMVKVPFQRALIFDPNNNDTILDLFDEYDKYAGVYEVYRDKADRGRAWQLSQIGNVQQHALFRPRFRKVVMWMQLQTVDLEEEFAAWTKGKGNELNAEEKTELERRIRYAKIWIEQYAPEEKKVGQLAEHVAIDLTSEQKKYLREVSTLLEKEWKDPELLQQALYQTSKNLGIPAKLAFGAIYGVLTGKTSGPKAAWLILAHKKEEVKKRVQIATSRNSSQ